MTKIYTFAQYGATEKISTDYDEIYAFMLAEIEPDSELYNDDGTISLCAECAIETWDDAVDFDANDVIREEFEFTWVNGKPVLDKPARD